MLVEIFECHETASEPIEACEEAVSIMEQLDLKGQLGLVKPKSETAPASRCAYREITAEEMFVYSVLCPDKKPLCSYSATPIPLRVLQVAAHAQSLGMFKRFEVWDRASVEIKDPVLVAHTHGEYEWSGAKTFILARWGEQLEAFATLLRQATALRREYLREKVRSIASQVETCTDAEMLARGDLNWN